MILNCPKIETITVPINNKRDGDETVFHFGQEREQNRFRWNYPQTILVDFHIHFER